MTTSTVPAPTTPDDDPADEPRPPRRTSKRTRTIARHVPITEIMTADPVCAAPELPLGELVRLMVEKRLGCVPVVDETGRPIGMVTKTDLVEQMMDCKHQSAVRVAEVMMPLAITLDDTSTVSHAAALMSTEDMHHVMVVKDRTLVGVVSTADIARWLYENDGAPA